jgi:lipopolysaccharide biosynthesis glycosyltransferase
MSGVRERGHARPYYNTGVLVMDIERCREVGLADRALEYAAADSGPLRWADQDALNAVAEQWHELDRRWNVQQRNLFLSRRQRLISRRQRESWRLYRQAAVLHFVGPNPWDPECLTPGTMGWVRALLRSGWYSPVEAVTWLTPWATKRARHWLEARRKR